MEQIERVAQMSILRALGFAALAIGTFMIGMSFEPALCFQSGAILTLLTAAILVWKGREAPTRPIRRTELWIILDGELGLPPDRAQRLVGALLQRLYYGYARIAVGIALGFWLISIAVRVIA